MVNSQLYIFTPVHRDDAGGDAECRVHIATRAHGEKVVQPDAERDEADEKRRDHHRAIAEQRLRRKCRYYLREDSERRENKDVDLGVPPGPDEVHEHHGVAAGLIREEMKAEIAVKRQHGERGGKHGEGGDNEHAGGERRPAEHRHAQICHA